MKAVERWLEENFDRESQSMPGSSVSVTYIPKPVLIDDEMEEAVSRGHTHNAGWISQPISIALILGGSLASMTWLMA